MIAVVITGGGIGSRFGLIDGLPKQFAKIGTERILTKTINAFKEFADFLIVTIPAQYEEFFQNEYPDVKYVIGAETRQKSVFNALSEIEAFNSLLKLESKSISKVLITDAVRPFVSKKIIKNVLAELEKGEKGVIPAIRMQDTIKEIKNGYVSKTLNRDEIFAIQTPQGFDFELLNSLHKKYQEENFSDDSLLLEKDGIPVKVIEGEKANIKITKQEDVL